jgi:nitrogen fixation protein FixH
MSMTHDGHHRTKPFTLKGWHVGALLGGFFATVIGVNVVFMTLAYQSFPGEDVPRSYVQGLRYNDTLAARDAQARLGWQAQATFLRDGGAPALQVRLTDRDGTALSGATIEATLRRVATDKQDRALIFSESAPGVYRADLPDLGAGGWSLRAQAKRDGQTLDFTGSLSW